MIMPNDRRGFLRKVASVILGGISGWVLWDGSALASLRDSGSANVADFGAVLDGKTDDSSAFSAAFSAAKTVFAYGQTAGRIVLPSDSVLTGNLQINGQLDCSDAQNSAIFGKLAVNGEGDFSVKFRKTRYCYFQYLVLGAENGTSPGNGLHLEGGKHNGTYYNTIGHLVIKNHAGWGIFAKTDDAENIFRIGSNIFCSSSIQTCRLGGVNLEGASNNIFLNLCIEQCRGVVIRVASTVRGGPSHGNKFLGLYTENPDKTTFVQYDQRCKGSVFELTNEFDGVLPEEVDMQATAAYWHARGNAHFSSDIETRGSVSVFKEKDRFPQLRIEAGSLVFGDGFSDPAKKRETFGRITDGVIGSGKGVDVSVGDGTWDGGHLQLGGYHLWVDSSGGLRLKHGRPLSSADGQSISLK